MDRQMYTSELAIPFLFLIDLLFICLFFYHNFKYQKERVGKKRKRKDQKYFQHSWQYFIFNVSYRNSPFPDMFLHRDELKMNRNQGRGGKLLTREVNPNALSIVECIPLIQTESIRNSQYFSLTLCRRQYSYYFEKNTLRKDNDTMIISS